MEGGLHVQAGNRKRHPAGREPLAEGTVVQEGPLLSLEVEHTLAAGGSEGMSAINAFMPERGFEPLCFAPTKPEGLSFCLFFSPRKSTKPGWDVFYSL